MLHNTTSSKEAAIVIGYYAKKTKRRDGHCGGRRRPPLALGAAAGDVGRSQRSRAGEEGGGGECADGRARAPQWQLVIAVDVPGASREDVTVRLEDGKLLVISGEQRRAADDEGVKYLRTERRVGKFVRNFPPETANLDSVSAVYKERMPPAPEPKKRKTFEVKAG
ncbi:19.0 kDa class II heat shock protein-like [Ananas comosus]|uniref:19.0 kDa class II heat shock protein n=1 Tax=Ananas comosus TaxID=4615 RepID=A0A199VS76_ANACO|nr:19.0 kDa class II heat shock protein-like [Ananas comosus]OAY79919.1 19.0 kDa class II heat shock protein [Ananas comosus]